MKEEALIDGFVSPLIFIDIKSSNERIEFIADAWLDGTWEENKDD